MGWYKDINTILAHEPEPWLAYLHGQQINNLPHLSNKAPRFRGFFLQVTGFLTRVLLQTRARKQKELEIPTKYYFYIGSRNQKSSLEDTITSLRQKGQSVTVVCATTALDHKQSNDYIPFQLSILDALRTGLLFIRRLIPLYKSLKSIHAISIDWHFSIYCGSFKYLVYFYRTLKKLNPEFVITSNDHNVDNRCLLAVAHHLRIKTVYLQHASVSTLFPALRVNYAFLDGKSAADTYRLCEENRPNSLHHAPSPMILLTGQKKKLTRTKIKAEKFIGIAINIIDDLNSAINVANSLLEIGFKIYLRWHPAQNANDIAKLRRVFNDNVQVILSNPMHEPVSAFLSKINWLIAGNSSIHLEAALSGVLPIYYEFKAASHPDYYGYVKNGLAYAARDIDEILAIIHKNKPKLNEHTNAIRYYSATYLTEWDGKEGELVSVCLECLSLGRKLPIDMVSLTDTTNSH